MKIGLSKEDLHNEIRIGTAPAGVDSLTMNGYTSYLGGHFNNRGYIYIGAKILNTPEKLFKSSDMIIKACLLSEKVTFRLKEKQIIFSFLHLALSKKRIIKNLEKKLLQLLIN